MKGRFYKLLIIRKIRNVKKKCEKERKQFWKGQDRVISKVRRSECQTKCIKFGLKFKLVIMYFLHPDI